MLIKTMQIPDAVVYDTYMTIYTSALKEEISLATVFPKLLLNPSRKYDVMYQGIDGKRSSQSDWDECEYNVQYRNNVTQTTVKMYCATPQFIALTFCGTHANSGVGSPPHDQGFVDGLNATGKSFLCILITTVHMPDVEVYDIRMKMYTSTLNEKICLASEYQKLLLNPSSKNGVMYQGNYGKRFIQIKWEESEYRVQYRNNVTQNTVKM